MEHNGLSLDHDMEMLFLASEGRRGVGGLVTKHVSSCQDNVFYFLRPGSSIKTLSKDFAHIQR